MQRIIKIMLFVSFTTFSYCQDSTVSLKKCNEKDLVFGTNLGMSCYYTDKAFLFSVPSSFSIDFHIKKDYYIQFAPKYSWLWKWNEHYLTLPIHIRKHINKRISVYAGPAITWDIGYFRDLGISAGAYFQINDRSSIILSAFTFTLYDYYIDYLYIPVGISYNLCILKN